MSLGGQSQTLPQDQCCRIRISARVEELAGARVRQLIGLSFEFALARASVICGPAGSGKSFILNECIASGHALGLRRARLLSAGRFAELYAQPSGAADITNLPAKIAILSETNWIKGSQTVAEFLGVAALIDRMLPEALTFACPNCKDQAGIQLRLREFSLSEIATQIELLAKESTCLVAARISISSLDGEISAEQLLTKLDQLGFDRCLKDGEIHPAFISPSGQYLDLLVDQVDRSSLYSLERVEQWWASLHSLAPGGVVMHSSSAADTHFFPIKPTCLGCGYSSAKPMSFCELTRFARQCSLNGVPARELLATSIPQAFQLTQGRLEEVASKLAPLLYFTPLTLSLSSRINALSLREQQILRLIQILSTLDSNTIVLLDNPTRYLTSEDKTALLTLLQAAISVGSTIVIASNDQVFSPLTTSIWQLPAELDRSLSLELFALDKLPVPAASSQIVHVATSKGSIPQVWNFGEVTEIDYSDNIESLPDLLSQLALSHQFTFLRNSPASIRNPSAADRVLNILDLGPEIAALYAMLPAAKLAGLTQEDFRIGRSSRKSKICSVCAGTGQTSYSHSAFGFHYYSDCKLCLGSGLDAKHNDVRFKGFSAPQLARLQLDKAATVLGAAIKGKRRLEVAVGFGLQHLTLGTRANCLSDGEYYLLKLATLFKPGVPKKPSILVFETPTAGLTEQEASCVCAGLEYLARQGHCVVVVG